MPIVLSRPMRSDTQPKNGLVRPLVMRSMVRASGKRGEAEHNDVGNAEIAREGGELRDHHESTGRHHRHHDEEQPENRRLQHRGGRCVDGAGTYRSGCRQHGVRRWRAQEPAGQHADDAENNAKDDQGALVAGTRKHVIDRESREDGAEAIARRDHAGGETAPVGETTAPSIRRRRYRRTRCRCRRTARRSGRGRRGSSPGRRGANSSR